MSDASALKEARDAFQVAADAEADNRAQALDDIKFARLGGDNQWTVNGVNWAQKRRDTRRPVLTINMLPKFERQVMNDIRQNRPSIKVRPVDSGADVKTADVYTGLIRNIEQTSRADTAYDTAAEFAITGGFGYFGVNIDYASDDTFDQDILIERKPNPFCIYGDPYDLGADSSNWMSAWETELIEREEFYRRFKGAKPTDWQAGSDYHNLSAPWRVDNEVLIARWWRREKVAKTILKLSDGRVVAKEDFERKLDGLSMADICAATGVEVVGEREAPSYRVTHTLMTGAEVLEDETEWPGRYIPIVPVYGEDIVVEGKRILKSLIRDARDPQMQLNYWRSYAAEMVALQPKAPYVGVVGQFDTDPRWETANTDNHPYLEADPVAGASLPQRQMPASLPPGARDLALMANDDIKGTLGLFDASIGARSNETSGKAILARQREGDVSTFHFADNLSRAIRHGGAIIMDLIPKVYSGQRMVRVLGEDGKAQTVKLGPKPPGPPPGHMPMAPGAQPGAPPAMPPMAAPNAGPPMPGPMMAPQMAMPGQAPLPMQGGPGQQMGAPPPGTEPPIPPEVFDLTAGKYDLVVQAGPSYTTRREETNEVLTKIVTSVPAAIGPLAPLLVKTLDVPDSDKIVAALENVAQQQKPPDPAQAKMAEAQVNLQIKQMEIQAEAKATAEKAAQDFALQQQAQQQEAALAAAKAQAEMDLERTKAEQQFQLEAWKVGQQAQLAEQQSQQKAALADRESQQSADREIRAAHEKATKGPQPKDITPDISRAVQEGMKGVVLNVQMPRMKRTPVRDAAGMITHAIDEPIMDGPVDGSRMN